MNNMLENAIISIRLGVNDYLSADTDRIFSCVRNLYSGLLLLFKAKLLDLSPSDTNEVLIKNKIVPEIKNDKLIFIGKGEKTIDISEIKERFESLNIKTDWKSIEKIRIERNRIEHYFLRTDITVLCGLIVNTFNIANEFINNEMKLEPKELLKETWDEMLKIKEIFLKEKEKSEKQIDEYFDLEEKQMIIIKNIYCTKCGYELLIPKTKTNNIDDAILICTNCKSEINVMNVFEKTVDEVFDSESFADLRAGIERKIKTCPECNKDTFDEDENICYYCFYEKDYYECKRCGIKLSVDEQDCEGFCFYCYDQFQKLIEDD